VSLRRQRERLQNPDAAQTLTGGIDIVGKYFTHAFKKIYRR
jgi:hypothetical protein